MIYQQTRKQRILSFIWQHFLLLLSLNLMTLGVALCVRSNLGSSVISSLPYVLSLAGPVSFIPAWTIGTYTILMNFIFVICQILILRNRFELVQLFQLVIGFVFGWLIDFNMWLTDFLLCNTLIMQILTQLAGCTIMGIGIAFEIKCGSVTMPGEGISIATSQVCNLPFPKVKIIIDTTLVILAVTACYLFFGKWIWSVVGVGTLFAMVYVGLVVKYTTLHIKWFDRVLTYIPGFRRYLFGLIRFITKN
ncbi:MAG TPA: hypothetical protein IAB03_07720 [Candidatus Gallibacteroides avistercoris]|uniref:YitT family protein n=1 Tax=Candidatus Gallibacteroides avistercoris TaxID=2840833 RepID=A0A9D1M8Q1_9BACT|nr:hypothetical protein [Candidatus Gallibacteroides avistercoris]